MTTNPPAPPAAPRRLASRTVHGVELQDEYAWMRERGSEDVLDHLRAENAYTDAVLAPLADLRERLYQEAIGRIQQTDTSVKIRHGDWLYYHRTVEGLQYPIVCRVPLSGGDEQILLDQNELAAGGAHFAMGVAEPSPDHRLYAYATDTTGDERFTLVVKDLDSGELLPDIIEGTTYSAAWANDNRTIFYVVQDDAKRPYKVFRHVLGTDPSEDELVFHEEDERFGVGVGRTTSGRFVMIGSGSSITSEWWVLDADEPRAAPRVIAPRRTGVEYDVDHQGERFVIRTNDGAKEFRVMEAPLDTPGHEHWREIIGERPGIKVTSIEAFADHLVLGEREAGMTHIGVQQVSTGAYRRLPMHEPVYLAAPAGNNVYDTTTLVFVYTSLTTPTSYYEHDLLTDERRLLKQQPVLGGFDAGEYVSERITATAPDGTAVPMSIVYRKDTPIDGTAPGVLYGYGSYGISMDPSFSSPRLSLLDRGVVYAIAHIRGGGELGEAWREDGKFLRKMNSFTDFIACAEHLTAHGYVAPTRLAIQGGSAGGLLMGAVTNLRPDLFAAVVAAVPFVDVINTMLDPSLPLTVGEYEEWGNPEDEEFFHYMRSYSPYDNIEAKPYPPMLVTAGLNDPRVQYWEPAKYVAKLRATKTDDHPVLLKMEMEHGHGGPSGRYDALREVALVQAFLLDRLGVAAA